LLYEIPDARQAIFDICEWHHQPRSEVKSWPVRERRDVHKRLAEHLERMYPSS